MTQKQRQVRIYPHVDWTNLYHQLTNDRAFKFCTEQGREALFWEKDREFYIFYLFLDETNKKNKDTFLKTLNQLVASFECDMDVSKLVDVQDDEYVTNLGEVDSIQEFLDQNYSKIDSYAQREQ